MKLYEDKFQPCCWITSSFSLRNLVRWQMLWNILRHATFINKHPTIGLWRRRQHWVYQEVLSIGTRKSVDRNSHQCGFIVHMCSTHNPSHYMLVRFYLLGLIGFVAHRIITSSTHADFTPPMRWKIEVVMVKKEIYRRTDRTGLNADGRETLYTVILMLT